MAKRAAKGGVVISQEIMELVKANNSIRGSEVMTALREKFPKVKFNNASCQVAFANARKKLGLSKTVARKPIGSGSTSFRKPGRPPAAAAAAPASSAAVVIDISVLQAAKALLQHCQGSADAASQALKQIAALQMN